MACCLLALAVWALYGLSTQPDDPGDKCDETLVCGAHGEFLCDDGNPTCDCKDGFIGDTCDDDSQRWWRHFWGTHPVSYVLLPVNYTTGDVQWSYSFIPYTSDSSGNGYWSRLGDCFTRDWSESALWPNSCSGVVSGESLTWSRWWDILSSGWAFDACPKFCWGGGWGFANPLLFVAWVFVVLVLVVLEVLCLIFGLLLMCANVLIIFLVMILCFLWKAVAFVVVLLWHLFWGVVILCMWALGGCIWVVELIILTCIAMLLYPTYALPDAWQWVPWLSYCCCGFGIKRMCSK